MAALLAIGTIAFAAARYDGLTTQDVSLHDAGIWMTKADMIGRINRASELLDGALGAASSSGFDVFQAASTVLLWDPGAATLSPVDVANVTLGSGLVTDGRSDVSFGGSAVALLSQTGELRVVGAQQLGGVTEASLPVVGTLANGAAVAVSQDGTVRAVGPDGNSSTVHTDVNGAVLDVADSQSEALGQNLSVTAVGEGFVVWDADSQELVLPNGKHVPTIAKDITLQQPGPSAGVVAYATSDSLVLQPLSGGDAQVYPVGATGGAAAPAVLNGCTYGAWAGGARYTIQCGEDTAVPAADIPGVQAGAKLVWRINHDDIALNDTVSGDGWLPGDDLTKVDNWDDFQPQQSDQQLQQEVDEPDQQLLPDRTLPNQPPVAIDDELGARAGRTTILPVVDNDYDPDGDILSATVLDSTGFRGTIQPIRDGAAVQVTLDASASGTMWFTYSVSDGRGGVDEATVTLNVATGDANTAPVPPTKVPSVTVEQGGFFEYNFLPLWRDGEGDTLFLAGVDDTAGPESIEWRSDGYLRIDASSSTPGVHEYPVTVSDGRDTTTATMTVTVVAPGAGVIKTNPDVVSTRVGESILVSPLANDYSPSGKPLRMPSINTTEAGGARVEANYQAYTFTFTSDRPGTFYVLYAATLDDQSVPGIVRIDVTEAADVTAPPIVVQDTALIPPGEDVLVDVLANDTDPGGGVLVVQSVDVPEASGLSVAILEHRLLRITNVGGVNEPVSLTYRVSNGPFTATGQVIVIPVQASQHARAPIANDDSAVVRAGDVVTIDVLANDTHPDGTSFALAADALPNLQTEADATLGEAFVSDGHVRFAALAGASGTQVLTYQIVDVNGQSDSARVSIKVISEDKENSAPRPNSLTARVIAGSAVRIPIPLDGIDPEGDSVTLSGLDTAPDQGRITEVGQDWITYEAYPDAFGADSFTYVVRDTLGAEGVATVRVGIAKPDEENRPPTAAADPITVRPGHSVSVAVLSNDTDPEGQPLSLVADSALAQGDVTAKTSGSRIVVTAGNSEGSASVQYTVADAYGATALGVVQVTVSPDAPQIAPIARDDRVTSEEITLTPTVDVPVLINDEDPDGVASDLTISVDPTLGTVKADQTVTVTPGPSPQRIRYTVTDPDGLTATAYIIVPGAADGRPTLASSKPLEVVSGETLTINLGNVVKTSNGNPAILTSAEAVRAAHTNGASLVIDEKTIQYISADGYYGPDAVTFEVTDGVNLNAGGKVSRLSVPITVLPADNVAPTLVGSELKVSDSEAAVTLDLARLAHDWNPDDESTLEYALVGDTSGLDASMSGSVLSVGSGSVKRGGVVKLDLTVSDGKAQPVHATVTVTVVASTRRLASAVDDVVADANPGQVVTVSPLVNDDNPYVTEGEPLQLIAATLEQGAGAVSMSATDATVTVTPTAGTFGTVVVRYVIGDFTGDADRQVEGRIYVTVADKPDAPATPTVVSVESGAVTLTWKAPDNRGSVITKYVVTASDGTSRETTANTLKFDGLKNGTLYTFTVTAANKKGTSNASAPSAPTTPDQVPNQPEPPTLSFGDHLVHVSWVAPAVDGTPINGYTLSISPAPQTGSSQVKVGAVTGTDISGLENGVAYALTVVANNAAGPSAESAYSQPEVPAGAPFAPGKPTTSVPSAVGSRAQISINWSPADGNGDAISTYEVTAYRGGTAAGTVTVGGTTTSAIMELDTNETSYTFAVRGINKTPTPGELSVQSDPRRAVIEPGAPTGVTAATPNSDKKIVIAYTPGPRNGATAAETSYQYLLNGSGSWAALPSNGVIGPLTAGTNYTVQVRALTTVDGVGYTGAASAASAAANPFGPIGQAGVSASSGSGSVTFQVTAPSTNGRPITSIEYCTNTGTGSCSNFSDAGFTSGSKNFTVSGLAAGASGAITVRVTAGTPNSQSTVTKPGNAVNPPRTWVIRSGDTVVYHWENLSLPAWPQVTLFRCWNVKPNTQSGNVNKVGQVSGSFNTTSGSITVPCGAGVNDNFSIEPWQYGPWLQVGTEWTG